MELSACLDRYSVSVSFYRRREAVMSRMLHRVKRTVHLVNQVNVLEFWKARLV